MNWQTILHQFIKDIQQTTWLEFIAVFTGIASVWCSRLENIWVYPTGLFNTIIYVYISLKGNLFGEASVNFYYTIMNVYGWILWAKKDVHQQHVLTVQFSNAKQWLQQLLFFCDFLCDNFFHSNLFKKVVCTKRHSMGRCICQRHRLHRNVANGKEESRKLVLVDCDQHCIHSFIFCKTLCFYQRILFSIINNGFFWFG